MKVAIMTQPLGQNYGGMMQAWALQQVLKNMGHEVVTIDRQPDSKSIFYNVARYAYRVAMKASGKRKPSLNIEKKSGYIFKNTRKFIKQHIVLSQPFNNSSKLKYHFEREKYDVVIVGSDQTWRPDYSPNIGNYFLDFLDETKIKRIAYACSFGVDEWEFKEKETKRFAQLAKRFDVISVREKSGVLLCQDHLGVEATHVLDPTLLLNKQDYETLIGKERLKVHPSGIFTYFLDDSSEKLKLTEIVSKQTGESAYSRQAKYKLRDNVNADVESYVMPCPKDWLAGFANAKYVLTDSFHGMVFSIIFKKPFLVVVNSERGAARFQSLADNLNLHDNLLNSISINENMDFNNILNKIDFLNLKIEKRSSLQVLRF